MHQPPKVGDYWPKGKVREQMLSLGIVQPDDPIVKEVTRLLQSGSYPDLTFEFNEGGTVEATSPNAILLWSHLHNFCETLPKVTTDTSGVLNAPTPTIGLFIALEDADYTTKKIAEPSRWRIEKQP